MPISPFSEINADGPVPLSEFATEDLRDLKAVFFDVDDTFSSHGQILPEAYQALWRLRERGIAAIPVTGRPAGWCDFFARMWPVTAVVGENGAFYMIMNKGRLEKRYLEPESVRLKNRKKLEALKRALPKQFRGLKFASDQLYREFDLAIDYCEDVKPWPEKRVEALMDFCSKKGAQVKLSSIHVNTWFGRYDKLTCVNKVMKDVLGLSPKDDLSRVVYLGDSPNDEPFFGHFPLTIGVANVARFLPKMKSRPRFVTRHEGGLGFAEFISRLTAQ